MRTLALALGPLVAICLSMQPGAIQAATAVVSDDAYTSEASIKQKRGTQPTIWVNPKQTGFVRFDLSALPSNLPREQIAKATLRLWVSKVIHGGNATASPVESDWNELTITHATAPTVGGTPVGSIALPAGRKSLYVSLEITDLVRDWATGVRGNYGVVIKSDGSSSAVFDAKENMATSHEPTLEIVLAGPEGKRGLPGIDGMVGPQGIQGPQGPPPPLPSETTVLVGSDDAIPAGYADSGARVAGWQVKTAPNTGLEVNGQAAISVIGSRVFMAQNGFVQEFDPVANDWIQPQVQPGLNGAVSAVGANGQIYFFGGYQFVGNQPVGMKTVVSYNPVTGISTPLPDMPTTSVPPNAAFLNGHFYFLSSNDCQDYNAALQQ